MLESIAIKLNPSRFTGMSGKMAAILGAMFNQDWTSPKLAELTVTSDMCLLGRNEGDIGFNEFLGAYEDLESNFMRLIEMPEVGLTPEEYEFAKATLDAITRH